VIYAIRAVGTEFVKIGKANSVGNRLKSLETASPYELHIEAVGNWPDHEERRIHRYLEASYVRGEWYRDGQKMEEVISFLRDPEGLSTWKAVCEAKGWTAPIVNAPRKPKLRKDTRFFEPRPLTDPIEKRRQEREEWWRKRGEHSPSQRQREA
jgi:hypothetical protein